MVLGETHLNKLRIEPRVAFHTLIIKIISGLSGNTFMWIMTRNTCNLSFGITFVIEIAKNIRFKNK